MTTQTPDKKELLASIDEVVTELQGLMASLDKDEINNIPYEDSWTAAQLFRHVAKSTAGIGKAMTMDGKTAERDPGEKIAGFKKTFLDFSHKMKSPDFIVPEKGPYEKEAIMKELSEAFEQLKEGTTKANLSTIVEGLPFGPVTKLEMLHFAWYHTQRHLHQMRKICDDLSAV